MKQVSFTQMKDGTKEEYEFLSQHYKDHKKLTPHRLISELASQEEETVEGYKVSRLGHALQAATRAYNDGADIDWLVAALLHDIGDGFAPENHDQFAAAILRPYVREEVAWTVHHHGLFQTVYYNHFFGRDQNARDKYKDNPYYQTCVEFCERWDQNSFDPDYECKPLSFFEPMVHEVFSRPGHDPEIQQPGVVKGLPPRAETSAS
ncbi:HD domain-containing protein [Hoeflea sp. CAU 1731]